MIKVLYIYRKPLPSRHSIEQLFSAISQTIMSFGLTIESYYLTGNTFLDIINVYKAKADIYHITGDIYWFSLFLPYNKTTMTIHDIGMIKNHHEPIKNLIRKYLYFKLPIRFLKRVSCISELTKNDLINYLGINAKKLYVISNPLIHNYTYTPHKFSATPKILQIGSGTHKNLKNLILAVKNIECTINIVGKISHSNLELLHTYNIKFNEYYDISNTKLKELYSECDIVFFASLTEGFGLPILEAQAMGRSIITSNIEPMASICGTGGYLVNPIKVKEIENTILKIIKDEKVRNERIQEGLDNIKKYDLKTIAKKYIEFYEKNIIGD